MAKLKDIEYIDNSIKVRLFHKPMWFHPKDDSSDGLEYLVDYYFFDTDGSVIAHAIYDAYDKKKCDKFVYDFGAGFDEDFFETREEAAVPVESEQTMKMLEVSKGCDRWSIEKVIRQYNEDKKNYEKLETNVFGSRNKMLKLESIVEHFAFVRDFLLGGK